jgi:hypothetical protein
LILGTNELIYTLSALGITMFSLDVTPQPISQIIGSSVSLSSYSLSLATTVVSTVIIVIRILMVSRMPGSSRQPRIAMEIIVESAVLYSVSALVYTAILAGMTSTSANNTYISYANIFFAYMAVASHSSWIPVLAI